MRIATLLPSATEIVNALGLSHALVGISHSCRVSGELANLPRLTTTHVPYQASSQVIDDYVHEHLGSHEALYDLDIETLAQIKPDVIISQALCDVCAVATGDVLEAVSTLPSKPALIDLTPNTLGEVFDDVLRVGTALGAATVAVELVTLLRDRCEAIRFRSGMIPEDELPRVAFLEWLLPPFNGGHWNPELVSIAGGKDLLGTHGKPSSTQDWDSIVSQQPDVLFIACCGFEPERALEDIRLAESESYWQQIPAVRNRQVFLTDGNAFFSSPGPSLVDGLEILAHALHPTLHPEPENPALRVYS